MKFKSATILIALVALLSVAASGCSSLGVALDTNSVEEKYSVTLHRDLGDTEEEDIREYVREIVREKFHEEMELDDEEGPVGEVPDYEEIVMELETMGDDDIEENITYDIDYISYGGRGKKYHRITRTFNNDNHFSNWYKWMNKQGLKILGVHNK